MIRQMGIAGSRGQIIALRAPFGLLLEHEVFCLITAKRHSFIVMQARTKYQKALRANSLSFDLL